MPPDASTSVAGSDASIRFHEWPPSCVAHNSAPKSQPSRGFANRTLFTGGSSPVIRCGKVATSDQCRPPSVVVTNVVQVPLAQLAVPSKKPVCVETNVTDAGRKPAGTGGFASSGLVVGDGDGV